MLRRQFFSLMLGSTGAICLMRSATADEPKKANDFVISLQRSGGGFIDPQNPLSQYQFRVAKDGNWEFKPGMAEAKKGKLREDEVKKLLKEIHDAGFDKLKSNPSLGAADEPFMDITVQGKEQQTQKRIPLQDKLAQALEKKIVRLLGLGK